MAGAKLRQAQREIAIALHTLVEHLDVARAVHGLNGEGSLLRFRDEHILVEVLPVTRLLPKRTVDELRRANLAIAVLAPQIAHVLSDQLVQAPTLLVPEHHPGRFFLHVKEI